MNKKLLSTILILTMVLNITLPHVNVYAEEINSTSQSMIENQLKNDLGEEKANEIMCSSSEHVEYYSSADNQNNNNGGDDLDCPDDGDNQDKDNSGIVEPEGSDNNKGEYDEEPNDDKEQNSDSDDSSIIENDVELNDNEIEIDLDEMNYDDVENEFISENINNRDDVDNSNSVGLNGFDIDIDNDNYNKDNDIAIESIIDYDDNNGNGFATKSEIDFDNVDISTESNIKIQIDDDIIATTNDAQNNFGNGNVNEYVLSPYWYSKYSDEREKIKRIIIRKGGEVPVGIEHEIEGNLKYYLNNDIVTIYSPLQTDVIKLGNSVLDGSYYLSVFSHFQNVVEIQNIQFIDTSDTTCMASLFYNCPNLLTLDLSSFNTQKVTNMYAMFSLLHLDSLDLSSFNTNKVVDMGVMFSSCINLKNLNISSFDTTNVKYMNSMFLSCSKLQELSLNNFDTRNLINMDHMFGQCSSLTNLDLRSFNTEKVINMNGLFNLCKK